jgi:hypothetical protein
MNPWALLKRAWSRPAVDEDDMPPSIVLLLREPHFFTKAVLEAAGEKSWRKRFDGSEDPMYFVVQKGSVTMIKAGIYVVQVLHAVEIYLDDPDFVTKQLPREEQKKAWLEHRTWAALNLWNKNRPLTEAYAVLARLALELGDANCCGVYLPGRNLFFPNDGTAESGLREMLKTTAAIPRGVPSQG